MVLAVSQLAMEVEIALVVATLIIVAVHKVVMVAVTTREVAHGKLHKVQAVGMVADQEGAVLDQTLDLGDQTKVQVFKVIRNLPVVDGEALIKIRDLIGGREVHFSWTN